MDFITAEEKTMLEEKLSELRVHDKALIQRIAEARALGDLRENAEYHASREDKAMNDAKIKELEERLSRAGCGFQRAAARHGLRGRDRSSEGRRSRRRRSVSLGWTSNWPFRLGLRRSDDDKPDGCVAHEGARWRDDSRRSSPRREAVHDSCDRGLRRYCLKPALWRCARSNGASNITNLHDQSRRGFHARPLSS